jgi:hypothetical protein
MPRRQLNAILYEGELVQYNQANGQIWQATYSNGILISTLDPTKQYTSPSGFVNDCKGGSTNGYAACRVCRDGEWYRLLDLPEHDEKPTTLKVKRKKAVEEEEMPPKKQPHLLKSPQQTLPPTKTIFATVVESIDAPIEVANVVRVKVKPTAFGSSTHFYDALEQRVFERKDDGTLGKYKGKLRNKRLVPEPLITTE